MSDRDLHSHPGATRPHRVTLRHVDDPKASVSHYTDIRRWRRRKGRRRPGRLPGESEEEIREKALARKASGEKKQASGEQ